MDIIHKCYRAEVKAVDEVTGEIDMFIPVSTAAMDRDGEVVEPMAFKKTIPRFMKRPVLVSSHDYRDLTSQIGEWKRLKIDEKGLSGKPKYYVNEGNEQADWGFKLASKGMAAFSIGFIPKVWEDGDGEKSPRRTYKEVELLEISQVIVPSNREAIQSIRSKSVDPIVTEMCDAVEKDLPPVAKPEETDEYIRIPVKECTVTATIDISEKEGIKALYCGNEKEIATYLFAKVKGWTMEKARAWIKDHEKKCLQSEHETSQEEIIDEIDYIGTLIDEKGLNDKAVAALKELSKRIPGSDIPVEIKDSDRLAALRRIAQQRIVDETRAKEDERAKLDLVSRLVRQTLITEEDNAERDTINMVRRIVRRKLNGE